MGDDSADLGRQKLALATNEELANTTNQDLLERIPTRLPSIFRRRRAVTKRKTKRAEVLLSCYIVSIVLLILVVWYTSYSGSTTSDIKFDEIWNVFESDCKCDLSASAYKKLKNLEKHQTGYATTLIFTIVIAATIPLAVILYFFIDGYIHQADLTEAFDGSIADVHKSELVTVVAAEIETRRKLAEAEKQCEQIETKLKNSRDAEKHKFARQLEESKQNVADLQGSLELAEQKLAEERKELVQKDTELEKLVKQEETAKREISGLVEQKEAAKREISGLVEQKEAAKREISGLVEQKEAAKREISGLVEQEEAAKREISELKENEQIKGESFQTARVEMRRELTREKRRVYELESTVKAAKDEADQLREELKKRRGWWPFGG